MSASLVGSEMCIRDRPSAGGARWSACCRSSPWHGPVGRAGRGALALSKSCLLYTSDAADDM
eukprot:10774536-Alexandrium_andersonii.AAC.1